MLKLNFLKACSIVLVVYFVFTMRVPCSIADDGIYEFSSLEDILFDVDSSELSSQAKSQLQKLAQALTEYPTATLYVDGHTDERGNANYNKILGLIRANMVGNFLKELGIGFILPIKVIKNSKGEDFPTDNRHNEDGWKLNRRVTLSINID